MCGRSSMALLGLVGLGFRSTLAAEPTCSPSQYPVILNGYHYKGLRKVKLAHTFKACEQACCHDTKCHMYQFKAQEFAANECEIGTPQDGRQAFTWAPGWVGRGHHMNAPTHAQPVFHNTIDCNWRCYKDRYPELVSKCEKAGWPCTDLQLKGHYLQFGVKRSWNCHCPGWKWKPHASNTTKGKGFHPFHVPSWAHLANGKKFYGQHCEKHTDCISSGYCSIKKLHVKECLPCAECKSHAHAVDGQCPKQCETFMKEMEQKVEEAKKRVAKIKQLADSHKALADKKEQHQAHRAANPMEKTAFGSLRTCSMHKECPLTAFCASQGSASSQHHCLPCIHCVADSDAIDNKCNPICCSGLTPDSKCPAYCTKDCTKHTDCPDNGFCFGIAPHRCMACETCVADVMAIDHHCPSSCVVLNNKKTELEIELKDYFGDYDASIEQLLERQEKEAEKNEVGAMAKLQEWKGKYNDIQKKAMSFESEERKWDFEEAKLKAEEKKLEEDEEEWKEYEKSMQSHREWKGKLEEEEQQLIKEQETLEARQWAVVLVSVLSTLCCTGILCMCMRHKLKAYVQEGIDQIKRAANEREAQQYARMSGNQVQMEMDSFGQDSDPFGGPDGIEGSDL